MNGLGDFCCSNPTTTKETTASKNPSSTMPPSNSVGSVHEDNDQATVDTNTLLPKPSTTADGKSVEALIQRRLEIDRQLQALENETIDAGSTSGGSIENNLRLPAATSSESSQAYRSTNTMPAPQSPEYQYPGGLPTTDESVEHSYPPVQAPMHPINGMFAPPLAAPTRLSSSVSVGSVNSGSNHGPSIKSHASYPFTNPYDPQFLAAAVTAFHHQQHLQHQQATMNLQHQQTQQPLKPREPEKADDNNSNNNNDNKNASMLWKLLNDKEEELKKVRQTLQETQQKFQEQSLLATKLQTTLDQVQEAFEKERLLIKLQAEKEAQEAMFQKQLVWMENNVIAKKQIEESNKEDAKANTTTTSSEPAKPEAGVASIPNGTAAKSSTKTLPDKPSMSKETNAYNNGIKTNPSEENDKLLAIAKSSSNGIQLYPSIDESLSGGNQTAEGKLPPKPKTPIPEAPNNNLNVTNHSMNGSSSSDRFDPVYVAPQAAEKEDEKEQVVYASNDDDGSLGQTVASSTYGDDRVKVTNKKLLDPYGDKGTYTGVVLRNTGMPHGLGRMVYEEDRRVFEGDWRHGRWHGYGRASFSNGDSYEGQYKFDQRHGNGIYRWNDGRVYNGQFSEDKRHGKGVFTWPDGAVYDGDFVNGQRQGHGKYTFADGGQYEGSWKDGRYDGFGTCTWEDGRRYRGEWRNGMAHGRGTETYPNGNIRHEGEWVDDEPIR